MASNKELQEQLDAALAENQSLKEVISTDQGRIESLKAANNSLAEEMEAVVKSRDLLAEEKSVLMSSVSEANEQLKALSDENEALKAEVLRLGTTPDADEAKPGTGGKFELEGVEYVLLVPNYNIPGFGHMSANDVLANPAAQAVLVANGSSLIKALQ